MTVIKAADAEQEAILAVAKAMAVSARTAPKTRGVDDMYAAVVTDPEKERLVEAMLAKAKVKKGGIARSFARDALNVRNSPALILIGATGGPKKPEDPLDCGACGWQTCAEMMAADHIQGEDFRGPNCYWQAVDLGIALGSAVKTAMDLNVDNRMMFTLGAAAMELNLVEGDAVIGIPLSASGKNIFFDRG